MIERDMTYLCDTSPSFSCAAKIIRLPVSHNESANVKLESCTMMK